MASEEPETSLSLDPDLQEEEPEVYSEADMLDGYSAQEIFKAPGFVPLLRLPMILSRNASEL